MCSAIWTCLQLLNRIVERAAQNLTIEKLSVAAQSGSQQHTFNAVFHRLIEIAACQYQHCQYLRADRRGVLCRVTFLTPTMVRLRVFGILSAVFFVAYGLLGGAVSTFLMYFLLLPINSVRLYQIIKLVKKARVAAQGDLSIDWLKPFMDTRNYKKGDVCFEKARRADEMLLTVTGKFLVTEIGVEFRRGGSSAKSVLSRTTTSGRRRSNASKTGR